MKHWITLYCLLALLSACSNDIELPAAEPLSGDRQALAALPEAGSGPHAVINVRDTTLPGGSSGRDLTVSLYFPAKGKGYPLLLFSHGNWSDRHSYDRIIEHWVSHGYVVVAADHADCCNPVSGIFNSLRYGQFGLIAQRVLDMNALLDQFSQLELQVPALAGKADLTRIAVTGHSFGAFTAQQFGGAAALNPDTEAYESQVDQRISAVVALNPPGPMFDTITAQSWHKLQAPTLVTTGTWDIQPRFWPDWTMHLMSHENSIAGDKYALVTQGADHYLGNIICRTGRQETPQEDAFMMLKIVSTAFLNRYLKDGSSELLDSDILAVTSGNFAAISRR